MAVNKTVIQGRLVRTPEIRRTQSGTAVASFTVAWSEKYKEKERKLFLPCVAWRTVAEGAGKYFQKGQELVVEGFLTSRKWQDKDGNNRETVELVVDRMHFCGPKRESGNYEEPEYPPSGELAEIGEDDGPLPF